PCGRRTGMRWVGVAGLVGAGGLALAAAPKADDADKELKKFQGEWKMVSAVNDGKKAAAEDVKKSTLTIKDNTYKINTTIGTSREGTFKLDPGKTPPWIDATPT